MQNISNDLTVSNQIFGNIFSDDTEVVGLVSEVMPLVASFQVRSPSVRGKHPCLVLGIDR